MPLFVFLFLFVGAPLFELYLLIQLGSVIGAFPTIVLTLFTAILGGVLVRLQGLSVLSRVREALANNQLPAVELIEGAMLLVAGFLLLLPGLITDTVGFLLLVAPLRRALVVAVLRRRSDLRPASPPGDQGGTASRGYIEGEFRRED